MKPKRALKRTPRVAPSAAPVSQQRESQTPRARLSLIPKLETSTPYRPWASACTEGDPQSWFRKYDVSGRVIEEGLCLGDEPLFRWIYTYNTSGRKAQAVLLNGSLCLLEKRFYDDAEQLTRKIVFAANGTQEQFQYEYDGKRNSVGGSGLRKDLFKAA